ncbi:dipeptide/oligopeptide/nickel ABC transporter ATP-binding protein, partial [Roseibium sp.]|uniref:ATP-binding cassette domain-containing protein n=1 Tax=Roseibium sp. TaxID=1936156 RepID=UPI0025DCFD0C
MIFQDPYSSLNSRHRIGSILAEPLWLYGLVPEAEERREIAAAMLDLVGMSPDAIDKYPHQFSGGQRQRIAVARALLARPRFLICDEPTSALDVSIQAEILNLLKDLQSKFGLSILFISHNLAVVRQMSDDVVVLRNGRIEEAGPAEYRDHRLPARPPDVCAPARLHILGKPVRSRTCPLWKYPVSPNP